MKKKFFVIFLLLLSLGYFYLFDKDTLQPLTKVTEVISLKFEPIEIAPDIQELSQKDIKEILKAVDLDKDKVFIYTKQNDKENLYGGFSTKQSLYDLGKVGLLMYLDLTNITLPKEFNKKPLIRIDSAYGANFPQSNYFLLEDTLPKKILTVDGHVKEVDLDQDGTVEIISSTGTPTDTYIYKWINDQFSVANVNKSLDALSVIFKNEDHPVFEAYFNDKTRKTYRFTKDGLQLIHN